MAGYFLVATVRMARIRANPIPVRISLIVHLLDAITVVNATAGAAARHAQ
jgi:hypothetical protein